MSLTHGMNVDRVEQIGRDLKTQASQISQILSKVNSLVTQSQTEWKGKDATEFSNQWNNQHRPALTDLQHKLEALGTTAAKNANEQRTTSGA